MASENIIQRGMRRIAETFQLKDKVVEESPRSIRARYSNMYTDTNPRRIRMNYALTTAIYYGQKYDDYYDFTLSSQFGKPIVNATTSFVIGAVPTVKLMPSQRQSLITQPVSATDLKYGEEKINQWIKDNEWTFYRLIMKALRDGDAYINVEDPNNVELVNANECKPLYDNETGELNGYQIEREIVQEVEGETSSNRVTKYRFTYNMRSPFKTVERKSPDDNDYIMIYREEGDIFEERVLPIRAWNNELEDGRLHGNSEYRNILYPLLKYSHVLDSAIINNETASKPMPYASGVQDTDKFAESYGEWDEDENRWIIKLDGNQFVVDPGSEFKLGANQIQDVTGGSKNLLEILFYLICQGSETPEFVMGAAVNSSQASVETQMPVMVRKALRKQKEFSDALQGTLEAVAEYMKLDPRFPLDYVLTFQWGKIVDDDNKLVVEIADKLLENSVVTKQTYAKMLNASNWVENIKNEIKLAEAEAEERRQKQMESDQTKATAQGNTNNSGDGR